MPASENHEEFIGFWPIFVQKKQSPESVDNYVDESAGLYLGY